MHLSPTVTERENGIVETCDLGVSCIVINRHIVRNERADAPATYVFPTPRALGTLLYVKIHAVTGSCIFGRINVESMDAALECADRRAQSHELFCGTALWSVWPS